MEHNIKYTAAFLAKIENLITEADYILRYEKGHFQSGHCLLHKQKIIMISKFYTIEGKVNTLLDMVKTISLDWGKPQFTPESEKFYNRLQALEKHRLTSVDI